MKSNIVLIGMPGSGKSTIARMLAKKLGKTAIDGDVLIEQSEGMKLQEIQDTKGIEYFKELEDKVLSELELEDHIISPGGSVCYYPKAMAHLNEIADVIYLKTSCDVLKKRIHNMDSRGIVFKPGQTFEDLYNERTPLYEKYAGFVIDSSELTAEQTIQLLLEQLL